MLSDPKHIDDFFRSKEAEASVPAANADVHWLQMQQLLKPAAGQPSGQLKIMSVLKYAAAVVIIIVTVLFFTGRKNQTGDLVTSSSNYVLQGKNILKAKKAIVRTSVDT